LTAAAALRACRGAAALLALGACAGCDGPQRTSILLVTVDSLRPEALGCYGNASGLTPHIDRIAGEGALYTEARTVAPLTVPAVASILTGLYPIRHSVRDNLGMPLPAEARTLAELASEAGYETAAFVGATILDRGLGLHQGFDFYDQPALPSTVSLTVHHPERPALQVVGDVAAWLGGREHSRPFLLWVHLFDPHAPYSPPRGALERAQGNPYLGEVAAVDEAIGELRQALDERGLLEHTVVVIAGVHGESLGQHGEATHGALCYDSTLRVPLVVRPADRARAGQRSAEIASLVDLYPTLAELAGLGAAGDVDGAVLGRAPAAGERGAYFESYYGYLRYGSSPLAGWVDARGKYTHATTPEFFVPGEDPGETTDRMAARPPVERYRGAIAALAARPRLDPVPRLGAELDAMLVQLGYPGALQAPLPEPLADTGLPDVREQAGMLRRLSAALALGESKRYDEAIAELTRIVAEAPRNRLAQTWLATYLLHTDRCAAAIPVLQALVRSGFPSSSAYNSLGHCLLAQDDAARALVHFRCAADLDPTNPIPLGNVAAALERLGRSSEAFLYRRRADDLAAN
jgi:arylsulfatase A-like enzyme